MHAMGALSRDTCIINNHELDTTCLKSKESVKILIKIFYYSTTPSSKDEFAFGTIIAAYVNSI